MADIDPILEGLNPPQREAVLANDGPVLILAGAGSGKTRTITHKIAWLVEREGFKPWELLAVTFTNRAAREMRERCEELIGEARAKDLWLGTFHRIGVRLLRRHGDLLGVPKNFVIYDQDDQKAMLKRSIADLGVPKDRFDVRSVQGFVNTCKQKNLSPADAAEEPGRRHDDPYVEIYKKYDDRMREANACDFGDLLMLPLRLMTELPMVADEYRERWRYILVDEFQDTNQVQYDLLKAVVNDQHRICVVGDDDQSIYRWRGAEVANILGFDGDFEDTTVIRLEQNYRSSAHILQVAGALIEVNTGRHPKSLWTERDGGELVKLHRAPSDTDEAAWVARHVEKLKRDHRLGEMAILYRTHAQSRVLEDAMRRRNIDYQVVGGLRFYDRAEVKDVLGYLKAILNPADVISMSRIINTPPRSIGAKTIEQLHTQAADRDTTFWEAVQACAEKGSTRQKNTLTPFVALMRELMTLAADHSALAVAQAVIEKTHYLERLKAEGSVESQARIENVNELLNAIQEFAETTGEVSLDGYLEQVALVANGDETDSRTERLVMMTAHTAKGLEFDVVFVTGLEKGLVPHFNSSDDDDAVEEERRLLYVAMTRARHHLHLSHAEMRRRYGRPEPTIPSPFLEGLPAHCIQLDDAGLRRGRFIDGFDAFGGWSDPNQSRQRRGRLSASAGAGAGAGAQQAYDEFAQDMPDYEDMSQEPQVGIAPRSTVFHPTYGQGTVLEVTGAGDKARVRVKFEGGAEKRIIARFLTPA